MTSKIHTLKTWPEHYRAVQPKIAIGCPVRNRAWVLPEYLGALDKIEHENKMFLFLENDSEDDTLDLLAQFCRYVENRDGVRIVPEGECIVSSISTASPHWNHGDYAHEQYANLARVRNHFLDMFLKTDADFLLSVDSDVIVPPDIVTRLMSIVHLWSGDKVDVIVGAAISNVPDKPLDGQTPGNFMYKYETTNSYFHMTDYPLKGAFPVDLIGAVYLIPRSVIEAGARYAPHPTGEDAPFCEAARRLGYRLLVDMDLRCEHRMVKK